MPAAASPPSIQRGSVDPAPTARSFVDIVASTVAPQRLVDVYWRLRLHDRLRALAEGLEAGASPQLLRDAADKFVLVRGWHAAPSRVVASRAMPLRAVATARAWPRLAALRTRARAR